MVSDISLQSRSSTNAQMRIEKQSVKSSTCFHFQSMDMHASDMTLAEERQLIKIFIYDSISILSDLVKCIK